MPCKWNVHINAFWILLLWLIYINNAECTNWSLGLYRNSTRFRRQAKCEGFSFRCNDGSCIPDELQCDGKGDCKDNSDETTDCKDVPCDPSYGFKCAYGACVNKNAKCNGIKECIDSSDESTGCGPSATGCGITQYACLSGECIEEEQLCDGIANCKDNSDETSEVCAGLECINSFQCRYGACARKNAKCNGVKDCFDGSDEEGCQTTKPVTPRPPITQPKPPITPPTPADRSCVIPAVPANGKFINTNNPTDSFKQGDRVREYSALLTKCEGRYKISPPNRQVPICTNGIWNNPPHECARFCKSANSTKTTKITCKYKGIPLDSCVDPVEGTIANIQCDWLYKGQSGNPTRICRDGSWDYPFNECQPVCGQKRPLGRPDVIGGKKAKLGDYPWHVGIYNAQKEHICGGSILNQVLILSAAHCFTDNNGDFFPKEGFFIAAGKYYRPFNDDRDEQAQYSTIKEFYKPERYKGPLGYYEADIAVVVLSRALTISMVVQPVCIDWTTDFEYQQLTENNMGVVVGWGYTKQGEDPSIELKELTVPYIPYIQCYEQVPPDFKRFLLHDKVCAGFLHKGIAVCQGDSGGGLTFVRKFDNQYFIRGIVSTSPNSDESCDPNQYATYTLISKYIDFIRDIEAQNRIS